MRKLKIIAMAFSFVCFLSIQCLAETKSAPAEVSGKYKLTLQEPVVDGFFVFVNGAHNFGPNSKRSFDWGDGTLEYSLFPGKHVYKNPGTYTITRTIVEETPNGLVEKSAKVVVNIEKMTPASPGIAKKYKLTLQKPVVEGMTVTVNGVHNFGPNSKRSFDWGDGAVEYGKFPGKHTYLKAGTYTIKRKITENTPDGRVEKVATALVTVK